MSSFNFFIELLKNWVVGQEPFYEMFIKGKKTLDVGCGECKLLRKDTKNIYGLDINEEQVRKAREEGLQVELGDATKFPYEDCMFDVVYNRNIIEHLHPEQARQMFLEMKRVLKKNGVIILITPMPRQVWNTFGHIKPYPPMSIRKLFREVSLESFEAVRGLNVERVFYYGCWPGNKFLFLVSTILAQFFNYFRGAYAMTITKNE